MGSSPFVPPLPTGEGVRGRGLLLLVAACALVPYLPALWNGFAMDDLYIIAWNPLVHSLRGVWGAFGAPYWPPDLGGQMYRPLPLASFALDWSLTGGHPMLFHAVNLVWHAGVSLAVAMLARRWADWTTALGAGLIFAVHPLHVEAVANVIGLGELMAAAGVCVAVYAALLRQDVVLSSAALLLGLLSKENAIVAPALIMWGWIVGPPLVPRPDRRRIVVFAASWVLVAGAFLMVRGVVLHPYERLNATAPIFLGESALAARLTALAALRDVFRLLVFPLTLRVDYSPAERTIVHSLLDARFALGLLCLAVWVGLLAFAWHRKRQVELFGLGWIAIAFLPVSNLLFSSGVLIAERTLYLPSVGFALAAGAALARLPGDRLRIVLAVVLIAGAVRTALRTPVWHDDYAVTESILTDSPDSYRGPARSAAIFQSHRQPAKALLALQEASKIYNRDPTLFIAAADAAITLGRPRLADTLLLQAEQMCHNCPGYLRTQALAARTRGDAAVADSLLARIR